ncbi:MAG: SWIM zinc finger family protein [Akkermansiaceae bacterium]|nr:SWIM zinc finger family protein [Akkermansiaceae bacterium]
MNSIGRELVHIHGVVLGNYRADYETDIEFHLGGGRIRFFTECTCPVGYQCKHAAALLFQCQALRSTDDFDSEAADIDF